MPLVEQLKRNEQLPALCFNEDRDICEGLAKHIFKELQKREDLYKTSPEFQRKYNLKEEEVIFNNYFISILILTFRKPKN